MKACNVVKIELHHARFPEIFPKYWQKNLILRLPRAITSLIFTINFKFFLKEEFTVSNDPVNPQKQPPEMLRPQAFNFVKKRVQHRGFPVKFAKFLRTTSFYKAPLVTDSEPYWLVLTASLFFLSANIYLCLV